MTKSTKTDAHLIENPFESETVFEGHFFDVKRDTVQLPDGSLAPRQYLEHPGAVAIVAILPDGDILLERQYRHPVRQVMLELPAGKLDAGETPLATGQRELQEETGYTAKKWTSLGCSTPCVAYSTERLWFYLAEDLEFSGANLDDGELLEVVSYSPDALEEAIRSGEITDSKTITGWTLWKLKSGAGEEETETEKDEDESEDETDLEQT